MMRADEDMDGTTGNLHGRPWTDKQRVRPRLAADVTHTHRKTQSTRMGASVVCRDTVGFATTYSWYNGEHNVSDTELATNAHRSDNISLDHPGTSTTAKKQRRARRRSYQLGEPEGPIPQRTLVGKTSR